MDRMIFTGSRRGRREVKELLQTIFAAELIAPSRELWLVSPWISNIAVIDDSAGRFRWLNRSGKGSLFLVDVLARLAEEGSSVRVVTRPDESASFVAALSSAGSIRGSREPTNLKITTRQELHAKGLAGDGYCLWGSMNLTWSGTSRWEELVEFAGGAKAESIRETFRSEYLSDGF